jgi:UDP-GlcNAc3NAcA epimerase
MVTIVGARPQFIKAAPVSSLIRKKFKRQIREILVHTGQHYDRNMSEVFFRQMRIPRPKYHLGVGGGTHGAMTGRMLEKIEKVFLKEKPDVVLVYGDTNSTLAGALAAAKLNIPVAHIEAGLRSFNIKMPEETNRILTDRISTFLFCPTRTAEQNLKVEGLITGVHVIGDVMYDAAIHFRNQNKKRCPSLKNLWPLPQKYILATCHRAENTDSAIKLKEILQAFATIARQVPVIFPCHPRTHQRIRKFGLSQYIRELKIVAPLPFLGMATLEQFANLILTDSGGVQKEAFFYKTPCLTMRNETEWPETQVGKANVLVGADRRNILKWYQRFQNGKWQPYHLNHPYGRGNAARKAIMAIIRKLG